MATLPRVLALFLGAALGLAACGASEDSHISSSPNLPNSFADFAIDGKATKTLDAPEGSVDVYDPLQDLVIRDGFEKIYNGEASEQERADIEKLFAYVHKIQMNDLLRAGCDKPLTQFCWASYDTTIPENCTTRTWGSVEMSTCEAEHSQVTPFERIPAREGFCDGTEDGQMVMHVPFNLIGKNKQYLPTEADSFKNHFTAICRVK